MDVGVEPAVETVVELLFELVVESVVVETVAGGGKYMTTDPESGHICRVDRFVRPLAIFTARESFVRLVCDSGSDSGDDSGGDSGSLALGGEPPSAHMLEWYSC